jgi:hypothetical protein
VVSPTTCSEQHETVVSCTLLGFRQLNLYTQTHTERERERGLVMVMVYSR